MAWEKHNHQRQVQNQNRIQVWPPNILGWVAIVAILVVLYTNFVQRAVIINSKLLPIRGSQNARFD